jgi:hypothetical protein
LSIQDDPDKGDPQDWARRPRVAYVAGDTSPEAALRAFLDGWRSRAAELGMPTGPPASVLAEFREMAEQLARKSSTGRLDESMRIAVEAHGAERAAESLKNATRQKRGPKPDPQRRCPELRETFGHLRDTLGRTPTRTEAAERMGVTLQGLRDIRRRCGDPWSHAK